ncbi:sugar-transfer associated ATP-grasp domain-containing protein [uncultured Bacteroides sp.]|uniref:sugar-transfer associated ATP-grasp domain-containing protein n=1 Tax=uncultured Bacteroides sp. TaxID=162156 RepID=UPI0034537811
MYKKLKLYRFVTVFAYCKSSWSNSAFVKTKCPTKNRLYIYFDLIYWFVFHGFDFNDYCTFRFWNKSAQERKTYISLRKNNNHLTLMFSTPVAVQLFRDKSSFNQRFAPYVHRAWITTAGHGWNEISNFIHRQKNVIVKPIDLACGVGIFKVDDSESQLDMLRRRIFEGGGNFIIESIVENHQSLKILAPASLNTVRIVTVIDKDQELHIVAALLRCGNGRSTTDNFHSGGMACPIDLETGKLTAVAYGQECMEYTEHPYSHIKFDGYEIPCFQDLMQMVREVAFCVPEARYVGWDLAITPDGIELIEGNIPPGEDITQIYTGKGILYQLLEWK